MKKRRNRFKQTTTLAHRLIQLSKAAKARAISLPAGDERERLLGKAREADRAIQIEKWLSTPGLDLPQ